MSSCAVEYLSGGLRKVWSSRLLVCLYAFLLKIRQCGLGSRLHHRAEIGELVGPTCFASKCKVDM